MFRRQLWSENRLSLDLNPVASISFGRPRTKRSVYQYRVRDVDELRERCAGECDEAGPTYCGYCCQATVAHWQTD